MAFLEPKLFETTLRFFEKNQTLKITKIACEDACRRGDNYMSDVQRMFLEGTIEDEITKVTRPYKKQVVVKIPLTGPFALTPTGVFKYEALAFNTVIPELETALCDKLPFPKCVYASESLVVLEDLKPLGYQLASRRGGMNKEHCRGVIKALAKFHASSILMKERNPEKFRNISALMKDQLYAEDTALLAKPSMLRAFTRAKERFEKNVKNPTGQLLEAKKKFFGLDPGKVFDDVRQKLNETPYQAQIICHNDCWANNIMFKYDDPRLVMEVDQPEVGSRMQRTMSTTSGSSFDSEVSLMEINKDTPTPNTGSLVNSSEDEASMETQDVPERRLTDVILVDLQTLCKTSIARDLLYIFNTNVLAMDKTALIEYYIRELHKVLNFSKLDNKAIEKYNVELVTNEVKRLRYFGLLKAIWLLTPIAFKSLPPPIALAETPTPEGQTLDIQVDELFDKRLCEVIITFDSEGGYD